MADERFGPLIGFSDVEIALLHHVKDRVSPWLGARERKVGIVEGTISRPRSYTIKQTFTALPGEEQTPAIIIVSDGFAEDTYRKGDGRHKAYLRLSVAVMVMSVEALPARSLCGHYQAALLGLVMKHQRVGDLAALHELRDMKIDDIDEEATGRSLAACRIDLVYCVDNFVEEANPPDLTIPGPQPDDPLVHEVIVDVELLEEAP